MKNVQIIDAADNCTHSIFQATDVEFALLFPEPGQEVQFAEDLFRLPRRKKIRDALDALCKRPIRKRNAQGIHGTLLYQLERYKEFYDHKREDGIKAYCINAAQRRLFGLPETDRALPASAGSLAPSEKFPTDKK